MLNTPISVIIINKDGITRKGRIKDGMPNNTSYATKKPKGFKGHMQRILRHLERPLLYLILIPRVIAIAMLGIASTTPIMALLFAPLIASTLTALASASFVHLALGFMAGTFATYLLSVIATWKWQSFEHYIQLRYDVGNINKLIEIAGKAKIKGEAPIKVQKSTEPWKTLIHKSSSALDIPIVACIGLALAMCFKLIVTLGISVLATMALPSIGIMGSLLAIIGMGIPLLLLTTAFMTATTCLPALFCYIHNSYLVIQKRGCSEEIQTYAHLMPCSSTLRKYTMAEKAAILIPLVNIKRPMMTRKKAMARQQERTAAALTARPDADLL